MPDLCPNECVRKGVGVCGDVCVRERRLMHK